MIVTAKYLITGDGKTLLESHAVRLDAYGKIEHIAPVKEMKERYPSEEIRDYKEATLMPGLFDMHVHLGYYFSQPDSRIYDEQLITLFALQYAQSAFEKGITTVRDLSSPPGICKTLKTAQTKGYVTIPNIIHADNGICMTGGHGHDDGIEQQDGPWNIRAAIRRQVRDGAEWVKLLTSHRSHIPEFTQEELDAAVDECHRRGIKCAVHAGTHPSIQMCIDAGFDTIEHGTFMTVEQAAQMAEHGQAWTPTIMAYTYLYEVCKKNIENQTTDVFSDPVAAKEQRDYAYFEPAYKAYRDNFKALYDTGVTVCAGTDMVLYQAPVLPLARELQYMVEYGITPLEAIQTATANPAKVLGIAKETGSIQAGLTGDLLVVDGNAASDITRLTSVRSVYLAGKRVYEEGMRYI